GDVEDDDLVGLLHAPVELVEVVEIEVELAVVHVAEAVEVLREHLGVLEQGAVLDAALGDGADELVVLDPLHEELELEGEAPASHVAVGVAQEAVVDDGLVEQLEAEGLADELGGGGLADAYVAREGDEELALQGTAPEKGRERTTEEAFGTGSG